jgi:hypothetical protein
VPRQIAIQARRGPESDEEADESQMEIHQDSGDCSQFCSYQSTKKPQESTRIGRHSANSSIKNTYSLKVPIGFNVPRQDIVRTENVLVLCLKEAQNE